MKTSYPQYHRPCGWNALLPARVHGRSLAADVACDVAVIGAGYTGVAAARRLAELDPDAAISVLDSSQVGEGNPGRNSGFMLDVALANDAEPRHEQRMRTCNRLIGTAMAELEQLVQKRAIACDLARTGTYRAAAGDAGKAALQRYRQFLDAHGLPYQALDRDQLAERLGTAFYREGLYSPHCYLVQPAALIRGLVESLPPSVSVYENTPAIGIEAVNGGWTVRTPIASVRARLLLVTNNAFCKQLGIGRSRIVAMYTYAALTERLPAEIAASLGNVPSWGVLPAHRLGSTLRRTADGRLLIRSLYGYERERDPTQVESLLARSLKARFPQLGNLRFESAWGGATGFTLNGAPLWGQYAPGLFVSAGCNGGGIVKGTLFGRALADLSRGMQAPDIPALFGRASWMPPEPLRRVGFSIASGIERRKGKAEA